MSNAESIRHPELAVEDGDNLVDLFDRLIGTVATDGQPDIEAHRDEHVDPHDWQTFDDPRLATSRIRRGRRRLYKTVRFLCTWTALVLVGVAIAWLIARNPH